MGSQSGRTRAVSPVVGAVLLVAIVVFLSAVTAAMVLDLDEEQEPAPEVVLSLEGDQGVGGEHWIVHEGGDDLDGEKVVLRGVEDPDSMAGSTLTAGNEHMVVSTAETITLVYEGEHGNSYVIREFSIEPVSGSGSGSGSGLTLPESDVGCSWVDSESDGGTDPVKVDGLVVDCDVTTDELIEVLNGGAIIGDTESETKDLDIDDATLYGDATADGVINVQNSDVYGTVTSRTADVKIDNSDVNESISGEKVVEVINGGTVEGDAVSATKPVKVDTGSTVEGDITSGDSVKLDDATVEGDVYIEESNFDCTDSTINGQDCSSYETKDRDDY